MKTKKIDQLWNELDKILMNVEFKDSYIAPSTWADLFDFTQNLVEREQWKLQLSRSNAYEILIDRILGALPEDKTHTAGKLRDFITKGQLQNLQSEIRNYFESIPREYQLWVKLPLLPHWGEGEIALSKKLHIVELQIQSLPEGARALFKKTRTQSGRPPITFTFIRVECFGYGSNKIETSAISSGLSLMKQFFELSNQINILQPTQNYLLRLLSHSPSAECFLLDVDNKSAVEVTLPAHIAEFMNSVTIDEDKLQVSDFSKGTSLLGSGYKKAEGRIEKTKALRLALTSISDLLDNFGSHIDAMRIFTALEWAFDSRINQNETLALIQACIGLESLLGDDNEDEPLTTRLADRCAYLLGQVESDRKRIRKQFKEVYTARSKLIHGRRSRLSFQDERLLVLAKIFLTELVKREILNLKQSSKKT